MTAQAAQADIIYSVAEYLRTEARTGEKHEFYNGKLKRMAGGSISHNRIVRNILAELDGMLRQSDHFEVFGSDQKIYLPDYHYYLYPDAVVVAEAPVVAEEMAQAIVNPLLIVEVLSASTEAYDRGLKFTEYRSLPSFKEYVLVRQDVPHVISFFREAPDLWREAEVRGLEAAVDLKSVGLQLALHLIYRKVEF